MSAASRIVILAGIVLTGAALPAVGQAPSLTILDPAIVQSPALAWDMTPDNQYVAGICNGQVFRWSEIGGVEILSPSDWLHTHTVGISDDGTKIVSTQWHDDIQLYSPSLWTEGSGWRALGGLPGQTPPDGSYGSGYDISGDGSMAVGLGWTTNYRAEAWYWTEATGVVGLGRPPSERNSRASAVSANGRVIVGFYEDPNAGYRRPVRWVDGGAPDLYLGENTFGEATRASSDGSLTTGQVGYPPDDLYANSYLHSEGGGLTRLWPIQDNPDHSSMGNGISDDGIVVGWSGNFVSGAIVPAIWYPGDVRGRDLTQLLVDLGVGIPDNWILVSALAISPDGTMIVGQAFHLIAPFEYGAFVARIPSTIVFKDGFESGDTSLWSATTGGFD